MVPPRSLIKKRFHPLPTSTSGSVLRGWIPNLGREHEFHLISGVSIFLTYLSQTAPEPLRFPPLVPMNEKPPFCPRLVLQRCGSAVIRSQTVQEYVGKT